jgi:molybdopterin molybdotransferase
MTEVAEAQALILEHIRKLGTEQLPLEACVGRVLAAPVAAERDQPPFDRVTMDGIAVAFADWSGGTRKFEVAGTQAAGARPLALPGPGRCIEVMTGATLPQGTDTVIPVERIERRGGHAFVAAEAAVAERQYVHARGSDRAAGARLLDVGIRVTAPEMAVLAGAGQATATVAKLPLVTVVSTGDELVDVGEPIAAHQIRSSNDRAIAASLTAHNLARVERLRLRDDPGALTATLTELDGRADALILSGGVSMGQFDFVPGVLAKLGARRVFHRIRQRPGKPFWFGVSRSGKPIFALPGNPVSTLVCVTRYIVPALRAAAGETSRGAERVALGAPADASAELTYFLPVRLSSSERATTLAEPRPTNTSGDFMSLAGTDGFVELPAADKPYAAGTVVRLFRW